jgi:2-dehydropantoate 2-reductase
MTQRVAIAGVGALGGVLAAQFALHGASPTLIARGARLEQLRSEGLRFAEGDAAPATFRLEAVTPEDAGPQDVILVCAKAQSLPDLLPRLAHCMHEETILAPLVNGVPWWHDLDGDARRPVLSVDPGGRLAALYTPRNIVGCVVFMTAALGADGVARATGRKRLLLGDIDAPLRDRTLALAKLLQSAGLDADPTNRIRDALWTKMALNLATNPLSVVSGATLVDQFTDPRLLAIVGAILAEARALAGRLGHRFSMSEDEMIATGRAAGSFRTSMLQDFEAGRPLELEAIGYACLELAATAGVAMPTSRQLCDLAAIRAEQRRSNP